MTPIPSRVGLFGRGEQFPASGGHYQTVLDTPRSQAIQAVCPRCSPSEEMFVRPPMAREKKMNCFYTVQLSVPLTKMHSVVPSVAPPEGRTQPAVLRGHSVNGAEPFGAFPPQGAGGFSLQRCGTGRVSTAKSGRDPD